MTRRAWPLVWPPAIVVGLVIAGVALANVRALRLDPAAKRSAGTVAVKGTVACSPGEFAYVYVSVTQGRARGEGWSKSLWCDGTKRTWTAPVWSRTTAFAPGLALAYASATTFDEAGDITGGLRRPDRIIRIAR